MFQTWSRFVSPGLTTVISQGLSSPSVSVSVKVAISFISVVVLPVPPSLSSVPEAAAMLGLSRNFGYESVKQGQLPVIRFGKRLLIPRAALEKMLEKGVTEYGSISIEGGKG